MDENRVRQIVRNELTVSFNKRIGDTPTDAYQLANKKYVDEHSSTYGGAVTSGAGGNIPTGWTVSIDGSNVYTVTHNLGTTLYAVVALPASFSLQANLLTHGATTFTVEFDNSGGTPFATAWDFVLTLIT